MALEHLSTSSNTSRPSTGLKLSKPSEPCLNTSQVQLSNEIKCQKCLKKECFRTTSWISCNLCQTPWHWACVARNLLDPVDIVDEWYCAPCSSSNPDLKPKYKDPPRKSKRATSKINYADQDPLHASDPDRFINMAQDRQNIVDGLSSSACQSHPLFSKPFRRVKGTDLTMSWLLEDESAMTEPILIDDDDALRTLGMKMPSSTITIREISNIVGPDTPVEVIDVASQSELSRWTLDQWASYYEDPKRDKVRNVISLEVTETALGDSIEIPRIVREMDWVETIWPQDARVAGNFAGSSVFYHVLRGSKTFYFIRPTPSNLEKYEKWSGDPDLQESTWLGDQVDIVYKVSLQAGHTMIIPTGWIHAVYTPIDSLVFGGNYLHSLNIPIQLRVHEIENHTKVPKKFRFPFFVRMLWYIADHYQKKLEASSLTLSENPSQLPSSTKTSSINLDSIDKPPERILSGLLALSEFLISHLQSTDATVQHPGSDVKKLTIKDEVDHERIPDPNKTATSLRQLVLSTLNLVDEGSKPTKVLEVSNKSMSLIKTSSEDLSTPSNHSPLHIKIKRKASTDSSINSTESIKPESTKEFTKKVQKRPNKQPKLSSNISLLSKPKLTKEINEKKDTSMIIQKVNQPAQTEIKHELRSKPILNEVGVLVEDLVGVDQFQVEVKTTCSENRVVRKSQEEDGRILFETRTVKTVIEKVYFPKED
ncbi:JmjC domain-containing histone demethylation protein 1 [Melampsora americana]|nr:JmjC domain-containing histone demethylation protein 1 [Melampsora americana]